MNPGMRILQVVTCLLFSSFLFSQTSLPATTIITQNFNSIGSSATATLPANWRMSPTGNAIGAWSAGVNATTQAASSGLPSAGGRYNWATTAGTDRAIGFLTDGSYNTPNAVMAHYRNTTGGTVTSFTIAFVLERYVVNTGSFTLSFESSTDGTTWTPQAGGNIAGGVFASGAAAGTFTSPQIVYKTVTINATVANNADIYFRWIFNTTNTASQGLGLDNVAVFAGTATPVLTAKLRDILQVDNGVQNQFNIGDDIRYQTVIKNIGTADALNVQVNIPPPANTTLVPGSIKTSSVARDDNYTTGFDAVLNVSTVPTGVLSNDFGVPSPAVVSFGPTANAAATAAAGTGNSDNGGTVTLNANGTFTYTPATGFSGVDKFAYIAANGNLPNNEGIVTITVGAAATVTNDAYNVIGNVSIVPNATQGVLNNDAGGGLFVATVNGSAANVGAAITTVNGGNLTVNANGSFTYNPAKGYEGPDNFTYTANNGIGTASTTATVTLTVSGMIWFIDASAAAGGDGRRSTPFNNIASFQANNTGGVGQSDVNDFIYVFENASPYNGSVSLLNGQKLIGQDATIPLGGAGSITGYTVPAYSTPLPVNNSANGTRVILGTIAAATNAININPVASVTLRGFRIGNTTGFGISSTGFGTLTVLEVDKNGTGGALNLTNGALAATFTDIISTSSAAQGINLSGITGTLNVSGATTLSGSITQGILVGTTTANINFGNTSVTGGTDGISLQNNSAGTRTFGTLSITNSGATGFLHGAGGGAVTAGITTITNPTGTGIDIQGANADITFGATTVSKTGAGTGVNIATSAAGNDVTFASLDITTANGAGLVGANNAGQIIVTTNTGDINATNGAAINLSQASGTSTVNLNFSAASSSGAANGITLTRIAGTIDINGGTLTGTATGATFNMSLGSATVSYDGNITQNAANRVVNIDGTTAGTVTFATGTITGGATSTGVNINNANGAVTFANLNLGTSVSRMTAVPVTITGGAATYSFSVVAIYSTGVTAVSSTNADGTVSFTSGTVDALTGAAFSITGPAGLTNVAIGVTANSTGGTNNVNFTNCTGAATLGAGTMSGATTASFNVVGCSAFSTTYNGTITQSNNAAMVNVNAHASGTLTFNTGLLNATNGTGLQFDNADGTYNFNGNVTLNGGDAGVDIVNGSNGTFSFNNAAITNPTGIAFNVNGGSGAITHAGAISKTSAGRAIEIQNKTGGTVAFASAVSGTTSCTGINLATNTGATINFPNTITLNGTASVFAATGGGTITATNAANTIGNTTPPTTATALNISNTTIGAAGVIFQKISAGTNGVGIILNTTGNTGGGFTITGTGTTAGSGGIISQSSAAAADGSLTAGIGVYLNNTNNVSLKNMNFTGTFGNFGIRGFSVNNFSLLESNLTGVFGTNSTGGIVESAIHFGTQGGDGTGNGLTGTAVFTGNYIGGGFTDNVGIFNNNTGSLNVSFADGTNPAIFGHNSTANGNDGILVEARGNGAGTGAGFNLTFSATGVEFQGARGDNIQVTAASNATNNVTILNNTFHNTHPQIVSGGGGIAVTGAGTNMTVNYNVEGNSFRGAKSSPIHIAFGGFSGNARGTVLNNIIGVDDPGRPQASTAQATTGASDNGNGINMYNDKGLNAGFLTHATRIQNNQIRDITGIPIYIRSNAPGTGGTRVEATILNNIVEEVRGVPVTLGGTFSCLYAVVGGGGSPDPGKMGLNIRNNTFHMDNTSGTDGDHNAITLDQATLESYIYLPGYTGGASDHTAVSNFLVNAPYSNVMSNGQLDNSGVGAYVYVNAILKNEPFVLLPVPLYAAHSAPAVTSIKKVSQVEVDRLVKAALRRYGKSGATKAEMEKLRKVRISVSELPVLFLGYSNAGTTTIDAEAAGFGWFIDETPDDDTEFNGSMACSYEATAKMDLLTVLMHELGHHIGLGDDLPNQKHAHLMEGNLKPGERHMPDTKVKPATKEIKKA